LKTRILLADDEASVLLTLATILSMNGYEVTTADSAREAQDKLVAGTFDLVITDLNMETPLAGKDVVRAAAEAPYRPAIAIFTAYPSFAAECHELAAYTLFVKPMDTSEMLAQIGQLTAEPAVKAAEAA
jgi:DNA-binding NtrC family response regulator